MGSTTITIHRTAPSVQLRSTRAGLAARYWRRCALAIADGRLLKLKSSLCDPLAPDYHEVSCLTYRWTTVYSRLNGLRGADLVKTYRRALRREPAVTRAMVRWAKTREQIEIAALIQYLGIDAEVAA